MTRPIPASAPVFHSVPSLPPRAVPWSAFAGEVPGLASRARGRFEAEREHVLATLTADGAARVSGTGVRWADGRLVIACAARAGKAGDLRRDPRFVLHSNPGDGRMLAGDVKVHGRAVPLREPGYDGFWLDLTSVTMTTAADDGPTRVETWRPGKPVELVTVD